MITLSTIFMPGWLLRINSHSIWWFLIFQVENLLHLHILEYHFLYWFNNQVPLSLGQWTEAGPLNWHTCTVHVIPHLELTSGATAMQSGSSEFCLTGNGTIAGINVQIMACRTKQKFSVAFYYFEMYIRNKSLNVNFYPSKFSLFSQSWVCPIPWTINQNNL